MTSPLDIVLVRHGESEGNIANQASYNGNDNLVKDKAFANAHHSSWRLTKLGINQAVQTGNWLKEQNYQFDKFYVSAYTRAMETAALLDYQDAHWDIDIRIRERDRGDDGIMTLEQRQKRLLAFKDRKDYPLFWRPLNGESLIDASLRIKSFVETLHRRASGQSVLIVCHGEIMRVFEMIIEKWDNDTYLSSVQGQQLNNCQVIHYSRKCPDSEIVQPTLAYKSFFCPWKDETPQWIPFKKELLSNQQLLEKVKEKPRFFEKYDK